MPTLTTVIDDKSPLILYDNSWLAGTSTDDNLASLYYLGTFTTNNVTNGEVAFNFNGSAIWIYGAKRSNHGSFSVQVDGSTYSNLNGNGNNVFQEPLFNTSLTQGSHALTLTNTATGNLYVDIDMVVWQSEVGNEDDQLVSEVVDDTDSRFQYQEPAWVTTSSTTNIDLNLFSNGTGHLTQTYDASVTFTFTAVSLFGPSGPSNGPYSVQLDGGKTVTYNATYGFTTNYGVMIYYADNLGPGSHQIVLTNLPVETDQFLAVDYAELWTTATTNSTSLTNPNNGTTVTSNPQNELSSGAIAGIAVAAAVAVLSAGAAIFFYWRWKAALSKHNQLYRIYTPQQPLPGSGPVPTSGFSSSLETRSNGNPLRNDHIVQALSGRTEQPTNNRVARYDETAQSSSAIRDSRSIMEVSSGTQSPIDDGLMPRPLPEAPGGGLSLAAEFPKLAGPQRQGVIPTDRSSIAASEAPPNYIQATGNRMPMNE